MNQDTTVTRSTERRTGRLVALPGIYAPARSVAVAGQSDVAGLVEIGGGRQVTRPPDVSTFGRTP
jgi:hypothetical protein